MKYPLLANRGLTNFDETGVILTTECTTSSSSHADNREEGIEKCLKYNQVDLLVNRGNFLSNCLADIELAFCECMG